MLQQMRQAQAWIIKGVLWAVVLAFVVTIFYSWGVRSSRGPTRSEVATILGEHVGLQEFQRVQNRLYEVYRDIFRNQPDVDLRERFNFREMAVYDPDTTSSPALRPLRISMKVLSAMPVSTFCILTVSPFLMFGATSTWKTIVNEPSSPSSLGPGLSIESVYGAAASCGLACAESAIAAAATKSANGGKRSESSWTRYVRPS